MRARFVAFAALLVLGGCAINQVRLERAGEVVAQAGPLVTAAGDLVDAIVKVSSEAGIEFALADPRCDWPETKVATGEPAASLCDPASTEHIVVTPVRRGDFAPTVALIDALAAYVAAVDAVLTDSPTDKRLNLAAAKADLEGIVGDISAVTGQSNPFAKLSAEQKAAVTGLIGLLDTLQREAGQVNELKAIEANTPGLRATTKALRADLVGWSQLALVSEIGNLQTIATRRWVRDRTLRLDPGARGRGGLLTDAERAALLRKRIELTARLEAAQALPGTLAQAVAALEAAHDTYVNALENRNLTPENRRRVAQVTRERLRQTLALLAQTLAAFR